MMGAIRLSLAAGFGLLAIGTLGAGEPPAGKPRLDRSGDPLPAGALFRVGTTRLHQGAAVRAITASPDGKRLASIGYDGSLSLWELPTGRELHSRHCRDKGAGFLAFTPDSKSLLVHHDEALCLLDVETGKLGKQLGDFAYDGVFSADGKTLTTLQTLINQSGIWSTTVRRVDVETGKSLKKWTLESEPLPGEDFQIGTNSFTALSALSADGKLLVTVEIHPAKSPKQKQTLLLHDALTGKELRHWQVPAPYDHAFVLTPDNKFLITAGTDTTCVWDVATGKEVRRWTAESGRLAMAPDGNSLFSSGPRTLIRWDWRTGAKLQTYDNVAGPFAVLYGGKAVAVLGHLNRDATRRMSISILDADTGRDLSPRPQPGHHVAFSPDGRLVAWPEGGALVLAEVAAGKEVRRWPAHQNAAGTVAFTPDGKTLASAGSDKRIRLWNVADGQEIRNMPHEGVSRLVFSADGQRLASVASATGFNIDVCVWDVGNGQRRNRWEGDLMATIDPATRVVAIGDRKKKTLRLADARTGKSLHALPGYEERVHYFYNSFTRNPYSEGNTNGPFTPLFSPDGRLLLASGEVGDADANPYNIGEVHFWDPATGRRLPPILDGKKFILNNLAFSPDSKLLALMRADCKMCLMDPSTGEIVRNLGQADVPLTAPAAFTPDGRIVITAVKDLVQVWEVATGGEICRRQGHRGEVDGLIVSGDGRAFASLTWDDTILVWDLAWLAPDAALADPDTAWAELVSPHAVKGRQAIEALSAAPGQAVALLRKRLPPAPQPDVKQLARWIAELGSDDFEARRQAAAGLERLGESAAPALRQALAGAPALETRRRMEALLKKTQTSVLPTDALRGIRAIQVLERLGTPEARQLLQELARGAPGMRLTEDAAAALSRLKSRN